LCLLLAWQGLRRVLRRAPPVTDVPNTSAVTLRPVAKNPFLAQNGGMYVSEDSIVTIVSAFGLLIALGGGFAWVVQRMDAFSKNMDAKFEVLNTRIDDIAKDAAFLRSDVTTSRSEEHTSELQLRFDLVCRLLL